MLSPDLFALCLPQHDESEVQTALEPVVPFAIAGVFRCCRTWRTIHHRPTLKLFPRQVTRTLFNMFFAMCHKVKFIQATKHFRPLFEDDASRKQKLPTSHRCPADLAVSAPELPLRTETKTRMQTEAISSSHGKSDTLAAEKSKLELELEDAVENGFELRKRLGLRFQRAHAPNTAKHAEYKALKSHQQKAQFRRDWANQELRNLQQKKTHCQSYQDVDRELGEYVCFAAMVEKFGHSYDPTGATQRANVYAGKCDKMGGSWVSWKCHDQR